MTVTVEIVALASLAFVGFIQNMVFTLVSRSRQSANVKRHFFASVGSNGIWFLTTFVLIIPQVLKSTAENGSHLDMYILGGVYAVATALGSCTMQKINLGDWYVPYLTEKGKDKVGANKDPEQRPISWLELKETLDRMGMADFTPALNIDPDPGFDGVGAFLDSKKHHMNRSGYFKDHQELAMKHCAEALGVPPNALQWKYSAQKPGSIAIMYGGVNQVLGWFWEEKGQGSSTIQYSFKSNKENIGSKVWRVL